MTIEYSYLNWSKHLPNIDSDELDKSYFININMSPIKLRMKQEHYNYLLRCVDLNFVFTDYLESNFNFAI